MSLKLLSVNIEGRKHLDKIRELVKRERPEVICLMEIFEEDYPLFLGSEYPYRMFGPNYILDQTEVVVPGNLKWGVAILAKMPLNNQLIKYYGDSTADELPRAGEDTHAQVLLLVEIEFGGSVYKIATTHFTWSTKGLPDARQRRHLKNLLRLLASQGELVVAGDFNIPRGENELYNELAKIYRDNIPAQVKTTIDPHLHYANQDRSGQLRLVVDYLWSTPKYRVEQVRLIQGVSDHLAVFGEVSKV